MTAKLFLHGVPDSPAVWGPLLEALGLAPGADVKVPALPGFVTPPPAGFACTKDAYADWLIGELEALAGAHGPVDLVGHDWGALISHRVACLRPDLIRTWTVTNALIEKDYRGHVMARRWNTPVLGELVMALTPANRLGPALAAQGLPLEVAEEEAKNWKNRHMRQSILKLYRSANGLDFSGDWALDLDRMAPNGRVIFGRKDPYVDIGVAERFSQVHGVPLDVIDDAGHWALAEKPAEFAGFLSAHWAAADSA